jgi:hypothetical protein
MATWSYSGMAMTAGRRISQNRHVGPAGSGELTECEPWDWGAGDPNDRTGRGNREEDET